jgi:hypothetical protein
MLDPWIIEQIRRREEEQRRQEHQPILDVPLDEANPAQGDEGGRRRELPEGDTPRGVVVIDFSV